MNKLKAIFTLIKNSKYILIKENGNHFVTPIFGHDDYWKKARYLFDGMNKRADKIQAKRGE